MKLVLVRITRLVNSGRVKHWSSPATVPFLILTTFPESREPISYLSDNDQAIRSTFNSDLMLTIFEFYSYDSEKHGRE